MGTVKDVAQLAILLANGGMESGAWAVLAAGTNVANYTTGQIAGEAARSGPGTLPPTPRRGGGSVYTDISMNPSVPSTYCATAWVRTQYPATGRAARSWSGSLVVPGDSGSVRFTGLSNGTNWRQVSTCVKSHHTALVRAGSVLTTPVSPTLEIDDVDVHQPGPS